MDTGRMYSGREDEEVSVYEWWTDVCVCVCVCVCVLGRAMWAELLVDWRVPLQRQDWIIQMLIWILFEVSIQKRRRIVQLLESKADINERVSAAQRPGSSNVPVYGRLHFLLGLLPIFKHLST